MWSVSLLMRNAARTLSARYWSAFVASLLYWLFFIVCVLTLYLLNGRLFLLDVFLMALCFFTYNGCLFVGLKRFFQEFRIGGAPFATLLSPLQSFCVVRIFFILLWRQVITLLFSLLLVFPGIWKAYELKMVPFLLAENPELSQKRAFTLSRQMTKHEKFRLFLLEVPFFIVWGVSIFFLGYFALPVFLFPFPFYCAVQAEAYALLRAKAFSENWTAQDELSGFHRYPIPAMEDLEYEK